MYDFVDNMLDNSVDNTKFVMSNNQNTNVLSDYTGLLYLVLRGGSTTASVIYEDDSELLRNEFHNIAMDNVSKLTEVENE